MIVSPTLDGLDTVEFTDGVQSLRLKGDGNGTKLQQDVRSAAQRTTIVTLTFDAMSNLVGGGGSYQVSVQLFYTDGSKKVFKLTLLNGSNAWAEKSILADATKPYNKVRVMIQFTKKAGTAWFDNFVLSQE